MSTSVANLGWDIWIILLLLSKSKLWVCVLIMHNPSCCSFCLSSLPCSCAAHTYSSTSSLLQTFQVAAKNKKEEKKRNKDSLLEQLLFFTWTLDSEFSASSRKDEVMGRIPPPSNSTQVSMKGKRHTQTNSASLGILIPHIFPYSSPTPPLFCSSCWWGNAPSLHI